MNSNFDDIADVLLSIGSMVSPAELHGQLVAQIALGATPNVSMWIEQVNEITGANIELRSRYGEQLIEWLQEVQAELVDVDFSFELFLPSEDESLSERMEEFAVWCKAFMAGVAIASMYNQVAASINDDSQELLSDIVAMSQLDSDVDEDASEIDFNELTEYVRVGVIQMSLETVESNQPDSEETFH